MDDVKRILIISRSTKYLQEGRTLRYFFARTYGNRTNEKRWFR